MEDKLNALIEDVHELKELNKNVIKLMQDNALLEEKLKSSNQKHDEGRKVLHKRMDAYAKIFVWFGTTLFTGMAGIIWTLVNKILGG